MAWACPLVPGTFASQGFSKPLVIGSLPAPTHKKGFSNVITKDISEIVINDIILKERYCNKDFIILKNIKGTIETLSKKEYQYVLTQLNKESKYRLADHPRVKSILNKLKELELKGVERILISLVEKSTKEFQEVYEHGDFAPWNLIKTKKGIVPFDFEYFEETGLEYLDEIKYHFQIERLIHKIKGVSLINILDEKLKILEFKIIFAIFLAKEILIKFNDSESYEFELSLLELLEHEKA